MGVLGVRGHAMGGWIRYYFGKRGITGFNIYGVLVALLGAVGLIAVVRALRGG